MCRFPEGASRRVQSDASSPRAVARTQRLTCETKLIALTEFNLLVANLGNPVGGVRAGDDVCEAGQGSPDACDPLRR